MSNTLTDETLGLLSASGPLPLVIVTLGNMLRGDDAIGPYVADRLKGRCRPGVDVFDAGEHPEDALDSVVFRKPGRVVILDAADFGGTPGEARIISAEQASHTTLSTHRFPPAALAGLIEADTGAPVVFLGIQVVTVQLGAGLSEAVKRTGEAMVAFLEVTAGSVMP